MLVVFFLSTLQLAKLAFEKPINSKLSLLGYHKLVSNVPLKYLKGTMEIGLWYPKSHNFELIGFFGCQLCRL